jgi:ABC-type lipoprotein export system ATPase subunit
MGLLEARDITKTYTVDHRAISVLEDVSLSVQQGEFIVIAGSSGSGKTTLLTLLSGLTTPRQAGSSSTAGISPTHLKKRWRRCATGPSVRVSIVSPGAIHDRKGEHHVSGRAEG